MIRTLALIAALTSASSADTYKFRHDDGRFDKDRPNRCASPRTMKRLTDMLERDPTFTTGHGQFTMTTLDHAGKPRDYPADEIITELGNKYAAITNTQYAVYRYPDPSSGGLTTLMINIEPRGFCVNAKTCDAKPEIEIVMIQRFDNAECVETWRGYGAKL